jgi:hypothetical protein
MAEKDAYREFLLQEFGTLIDDLNLSYLQKKFLRNRWLDQLLWMEKQAGKSRNRYYSLRLISIIGGVLIPALVSLNINSVQVKEIFGWSTFLLSQVVAISGAVEAFFRYGERWRNYRRTSEALKTQGWHFFQLTGVYNSFASHEQAFNTFATQVENIIQQDVEVYITNVVQEKKQETEKENVTTDNKQAD